MAKNSTKSVFECSSCGRTTAKWVGNCSECGEWNTVVERVIHRSAPGGTGIGAGRAGGLPSPGARTTYPLTPSQFGIAYPFAAVELTEISTNGTTHMATGIAELDRVLGGGFVAGSTTLLAGDPGIGKSTLLLQAAAAVASTGRTVLYATGEEALEQIRIRASRLGVKGDGVFMTATGDVAEVAGHIAALNPAVVIVDSIQTSTHPDLDSPAGTVSQIRECAAFLSGVARSWGPGADRPPGTPGSPADDPSRSEGEDIGPGTDTDTITGKGGEQSKFALVLSGHVTKDGSIAGPRVLEHQVDAVLQMGGDSCGMLRLLHAVKNRFGPTDEVGVFEMREEGMIGISDPSHLFMGRRGASYGPVSGSAVALVVEGTRSLAVEIQALATPSTLASPRRVANGVEMSRVHLITAVLAKHMRLPVSNHDLVISVTGGLDVREPAADLAIALAIASSMMDRPVDETVAVAGEIGLSGELRSIPRADRRVAEASRLGFATCMIPEATNDAKAAKASGTRVSISIVRPTNIAEAVRFALQERTVSSSRGANGSLGASDR
ncbi:MAG: AAA family ATPase [Chloroflexi bacterium]|nr:AAA family ATPase [Chloroflexota bacterium]